MGRWDELMKCLGGDDVPRMTFDDKFFSWWDQQVIAVDDYPYAKMDFQGSRFSINTRCSMGRHK